MPARQVPDPEVKDQSTVASQADEPCAGVVAVPRRRGIIRVAGRGRRFRRDNPTLEPVSTANSEVKNDSTDKLDLQSADDFGLNGASDTGTIAAPLRRLGPLSLPNGRAGGCDCAGL